MKKMINTVKVEGRVFSHSLAKKTVQDTNSANYGKEFINGVLEIAVDEEGLNVVPVHFTYVTEMTKKGEVNSTYTNLDKIINENKLWSAVGKDGAQKVKVDTALGVNDFYNQENILITTKVNEGGFVRLVNDLGKEAERSFFTEDMFITSTKVIEKNEERNIDEDYLMVSGAVFNFRGDLLPVDFVVRNTAGMKYFEDMGATNATPVFTKVWGNIICKTIVTTKEEESAFGEPQVRTYERKTKEYILTGASKEAYDFGDESILTTEDVQKAMADRELVLAENKKRSDAYRANREAGNDSAPKVAAAAPKATPAGNFVF